MSIIRNKIMPNHRLLGQSETHQMLSQMALTWAANKATLSGSKGAIELGIYPNWGIADAVVMQTFQGRFHQIYGFEKYGYYNRLMLVFETKVSKADFKTIFPKIEKAGNSPGNLNWIVAVKNLIAVEELPAGWGLLEGYGSGLREIHKPLYFEKSELDILKVESRMLWDHRWYRKNLKLVACPECGKEIEAKSEH